MKVLDVITALLVIVGGLNWGLVGAIRFDLVATLFGEMTRVSQVVYTIIGVSAIYQLFEWRAVRKRAAPA